MESYTKLVLLAIVLVAVVVTEPMATNGFPICGINTDDLKTCQPAVAKGVDPLPAPTAECCAALTNANVPCFCKLKDKNPTLFAIYGIDPKHCMELPAKCNLPQAASTHC
uniref:putative lipid-transfer protein DIR1 n=1 Tax=Erigeron canadensis TaxID=72917 RepID=UPI001CB893E3|nr:putative lipid-transfer protein DIR1 [Erigeron canadensis]